MTSSAEWDPYGDPVNKIVLAGSVSPGLADVAGAGSPRKWEERQGYGMGGATLVFLGNGLSQFDVTLRLYTRKDVKDWHKWKKLVQRVPNTTRYRAPRALDIYHPLLAEVQIKSVVILDVLQPEPFDDTGVWAIKIKFQAYRRMRIQLAKPEASKDQPLDRFDQLLLEATDTLIREERGGAAAYVQRLAGPPGR